MLTVYAYVCQVVGAAIAIVALEKGRTPLVALPGFVVLTVIDFSAGGLAFYSGNANAAKAISALAMVFNFFWTLCFYSISLLMPSELPTQRLRNYTMSYAIGWGQATAVVTTLALPQITASDAGNLAAKAYTIFGGCMLVITILAFFLLPETRGRTFVEIDQLYSNRIPAWRWSQYEFSRAPRALTSEEASHLDGDTQAVGLISVEKKPATRSPAPDPRNHSTAARPFSCSPIRDRSGIFSPFTVYSHNNLHSFGSTLKATTSDNLPPNPRWAGSAAWCVRICREQQQQRRRDGGRGAKN